MTGTEADRLARVESAVRGLGREVEAVRIACDGLATTETVSKVGARVAELFETVADLGEAIERLAAAKEREPVLSWLTSVTDPSQARMVLAELVGWLIAVYLRYTDAATRFPECWLWHPDVIEELVWLRQAWRAAYLREPSVRAVGDWHDRHRPGVVRRISQYAQNCSLENHQHHRTTTGAGAPAVPVADAASVLADWWATGRNHTPAPEPSADQITEALAAINRRARHDRPDRGALR